MLKYGLKCAGKNYDGQDDELIVLCETLDVLKYFDVDLSFFDTVTNISSELIKPCDPLHYIIILSLIVKNALREENTEVTSLMPYIERWLDHQTKKLEETLSKKSQEKTEFHYAREVFKERSAYNAIIQTLEGIMSIISELYFRELYRDGLIQYCNSLKKFSRALRKALDEDPILSKVKHKPNYKKSLDVLDFEVTLGLFDTLFHSGKYLKAEAVINKSLFYVEKIHNSEKSFYKYLLYSFQALISTKRGYVELVLQALENREGYKKDLNKVMEDISKYLKRFNCDFEIYCFLGHHYSNKGQYHNAIRYFEMSCKSTDQLKHSKNATIERDKCVPEYLMQLAQFSVKKYPKLIETIKVFPKSSKLALYFHNKKYADQFSDIMKYESLLRAKSSKVDDEKCIVSFKIGFDFSFEKFKESFERVKKTFERDVAKKIKEKEGIHDKTTEKNNAVEKPNYAGLLYSTSELYKKRPQKKGKRPKKHPSSKNNSKQAKICEKVKLDRVEFSKYGKVFDPDPNIETDVVTLQVKGMNQHWYAFLNPNVLKYILNKEEANKISRKFQKEKILSGDMCVPCTSEFSSKESYFFKIRLIGKCGKSDIRIYALPVETVGNKRLAVFTAINTKSHAKNSQPKYIPLPEHQKESDEFNNNNDIMGLK